MLYEQAIAQIAHLRPDELSFSVDYSLILVSHFQLIELTALFERIANYGQTGNARVLMPSIMDPLQLTVVARRGFLPYFGDSICFDEGPGPLAIRFVGQNWPFNRETRAPLMASLASVKFHYGKEFAEVSALVNQLSASFIHRPMAQKCTIGFATNAQFTSFHIAAMLIYIRSTFVSSPMACFRAIGPSSILHAICFNPRQN